MSGFAEAETGQAGPAARGEQRKLLALAGPSNLFSFENPCRARGGIGLQAWHNSSISSR